MAEQRNREGQQLGNYRLERLLGRGGFAEVYLGQHLRLKRQAAIKVLHAYLSEQEIDAFQQEAEIIAGLEQPHIVHVLDFDVQNGVPFLVMDYLPNGTLRQRHRRGEQVPLPTVVSYVKQVAEALQYAHEQRLIHRDVKPENMLLGRRDEVVLSDFGIAAIAHSTSSMTAQASVGTIPYMAPEQIQEHPRAASDQYALGIVVYEWLSGELPFTGSFTEIFAKHLMTPPPPLRQKVPALSAEVEQVVSNALAKDPRQRFGSIQAFATALEKASQATQQPVGAAVEETVLPQHFSPQPSSSLPPTVLAAPAIVAPTDLKTPAAHTLEPTIAVPPPEHTLEPTIAVPPPAHTLESTIAVPPPAQTPASTTVTPPTVQAAPPKRVSKPKPSRRTVIIGLLLVLAILFASIGGVIYAANTVNRATATDAINSNIAQMNASNSAQLDPALAASNPDPYPPTNGKLTLYDPMHDNTNKGFGWEENSGCMFTGTGYQVGSACRPENLELNNFALEITVDFTQTSSLQGADVFFRDTSSPDTYYVFTISNDGTYDFGAGATTLLGASVHPISLYSIQSDAIHQGAQTNTIAIVAIGSTIDLYANGVKINSFEDSSSNYGGMFLAQIGSLVNFSNAKLWTF